jgi:Activator of Hsp90 ATPase homolog 1-like protein
MSSEHNQPVFTYHTRVSVTPEQDQMLRGYTSLFGRVERTLYADMQKGKDASELKSAYLARFEITARPCSLEGEFTVVEAPWRLAHTWKSVGSPEAPTTVSYRLDQSGDDTRITLRHTGFSIPEVCMNTAIGWETSFDRLAQLLGSEPK